MDGNEIYEKQYINKIERVIKLNPDKTFLNGFYYYLCSGDLSYSTIYDYLNYAVNFINHVNKKANELTLDDYTNFLIKFKSYTSSYQINVYSGIKWLSLYLYLNKITTDNPMQYIAKPKFKEGKTTIQKRENGYLDKNQIKTYLETTKNGVGSNRAKARQKDWKSRDLSIVMLFLNTGMRCSALYKLDVDSINFTTGMLITIDKGDNIQEYKLSYNVLEIIKEWISKRTEILNGLDENALFISNQKTRMNQSSISRVVNKYAQDIKHITPHKLRATYGTQLIQETGNIYFVQQCMGHKDPKTTGLYIRGQKQANREKACDIMSEITIV